MFCGPIRQHALLFVVILCTGAILPSCTGGQPRATDPIVAENSARSNTTDGTVKPAPERFFMKPFHYIIRQHRELGTHIDGPRCPMYPSCGAYADRIIREDGFSGFLLFVDRLFYREFGRLSDRYMVAPRRLSKSPRYYDPVSDVLPPEDAPVGRRPSFFREEFRN